MSDIKILNPIDQVKGSPKVNPETYGFISTREILDTFAKHGWTQVSAQSGKTRTENQGFQKHLIKLEHPDFSSIEGLSESNRSKPQLVFLNSHDGTTASHLFWGLLRTACLNGVISGTALSSMRLIHSRRVNERLPQAIEYMVANFPKFLDQIRTLQGRTFSDSASQEFIRRVFDARLQNVQGIQSIDYKLPRILRIADTSNDAFTVFNRVQEALIRGGIRYLAERRRLDDEGNVLETRLVEARTRKLSSVTQHVNLNRIVYDAALELSA